MSTTVSMAHVCSGPGCTLAGSIAPDTRGKGPWFCWWHFRAFTAHESLGDVTDAINRGDINPNAPIGCLWADEQRRQQQQEEQAA